MYRGSGVSSVNWYNFVLFLLTCVRPSELHLGLDLAWVQAITWCA